MLVGMVNSTSANSTIVQTYEGTHVIHSILFISRVQYIGLRVRLQAASARRYHVSAMFNHKIWVIRGNPNEITNDVRYSSDGVAWIQATATTAWPERSQNGSVVHESKMWVLRGVNTGTLYRDVWCSSYGITWNQAITAADCAARGRNKNTIPWCLVYAMARFCFNWRFLWFVFSFG